MDGREIHYSSNRVGILDFSWNTKGNHVLKTVCHAAPPMQAQPGFRQYELLIDGQSFFQMPKMFELGIKGTSAADNRVPGVRSNHYQPSPAASMAPRTPAEEDEDLQRAIRASLEESATHLNERKAPDVLTGAGSGMNSGDLLGGGPVSPASTVPAIMPDPSMNSFTSAPQPVGQDYGYHQRSQSQPGSFAALPPPSPAYSAPPPQASSLPTTPHYGAGAVPALPAPPSPAYTAPVAPFSPPYTAPAHPPPASFSAPPPPSPMATGDPLGMNGYHDPFAPKPPSSSDVANDILKAYSSTSPTNGYGAPPSSGQYQPGQPFANGGAMPAGAQGPPPPQPGTPKLSMNSGLALTETAAATEAQNPFDAAMKKLVNFDNIDQPAEEQLKLTMKQKDDDAKKKNQFKSKPLPPAANRVVGSGATLSQISGVKAATKTESVMKPPPGLFQSDAAMAGALVVHGQGPPPLQPQGFGVVHMQGQYPQQQQASYYQQQQQRGYR